jgi:aspartate/methionine/tyrosine aminotransferase
VINFPHNPTGAMVDREALERVVEIADAHGAVLFSDEVYRYLEVDERDRLPAAADLSPRAISLGVLSKAFALAGLRIGWIATRDRAVLDRVARLKDYTTICGSAPSEVLGLMALRARDRVLERSREIVACNLPLLDAFFARTPELFRWVRPRGGSTAYPELLVGDASRFADALVEREGVLVVPAERFGDSSSHFRVGLGRRDLPVALEKLERFATRDWLKGQGPVRH